MKITFPHDTLAITVCYGLILMCLWLFPGAGIGAVIFGTLLATALCAGLFRALPGIGPVSRAIVVAAAALSLCALIVNINYFTVAAGADAAHPILLNGDARRDWSWGCTLAFGTPDPYGTLREFAFVVAGLLSLFGRSITGPIMFCWLCYVATLPLIGAIAARLTSDRRIATVAVALAALSGYLFAQSGILIKDCPVALCFAVAAFVFARWSAGDSLRKPGGWVLLGAAMVLLAMMRVNGPLMLALVAGAFCITDFRRLSVPTLIIAAFAATVSFGVNNLVLDSPLDAVRTLNAKPETDIVLSSAATAPLDNIIGDYTAMAPWRKLLWLPLTAAVQFLLPFPWGWERHIAFGPSQAVAHFGFAWYAAGGLILYGLFGKLRCAAPGMRALALSGAVLTLLTAFITSGRVARYCLAYLPLLLPFAAWVGVTYYRRRSMRVWMGAFASLLAAALLICYRLQHTS